MFLRIEAKKISAIVFVFLALFFGSGTASATITDNAVGWLWGESEDAAIGGSLGIIDGNETGVGWISLNSININCDADNNGFRDATLTCGGDNSTTLPINYGVTFPLPPEGSTVGNPASGYAWSENVGWVSFNESDLSGCPDGNCWAKIDGDSLKGWARVLGIKDALAGGNSGGWSGFIHLDGLNYKATFDSLTGELGGHAWNGENTDDPPVDGITNIANGLGSVNFSRAGIATTLPPRIFSICRESCGSNIDLSDTTASLFFLGDLKRLKACYYSFGCQRAEGTDVTSSSIWAEQFPGSGAISLSGGNPNIATAAAEGNETVTAEYLGIQASTNFAVSFIPPKTCWRCDSVNHSCSSGLVYAATCPAESPIDSESECNTICKQGSWKEVAP